VSAFKKNREKIIGGLAVVLLLSMLMSWSTNNPNRLNFLENLAAEALYPFQYAASAITGLVRNSWEFVLDVRDVYLENQSLKKLVDKYAGIELELYEVRQENLRLRALLEFKEGVQFEMEPAQVIGRNPSSWFSTLTINKGTRDGIKVDMPVLTNQGLVGKTIAVYPSFAKVQLLISPDSGISAIVQRTRDNGVLVGLSSPKGYAQITRLHQKADIQVGDVIISSPLTGVYPKGIAIGRVVEVMDDPVSLERSALVKPEVDFDRLEEVLIIVNYQDEAGGTGAEGQAEVQEGDGQ
jgi:rod shape-determining protein MreC